MTQEIIVYNNPLEAKIYEALSSDMGVSIIGHAFFFMIIVISCFLLVDTYNKKRRHDLKIGTTLILIVSLIVYYKFH